MFSLLRQKNFLCRPEIGPKHFDKLKLEPALPKKPGPTYNSGLDIFQNTVLNRFKQQRLTARDLSMERQKNSW